MAPMFNKTVWPRRRWGQDVISATGRWKTYSDTAATAVRIADLIWRGKPDVQGLAFPRCTVWRWLPDMVVGDVCAQAHRHLRNAMLSVYETRSLGIMDVHMRKTSK